MQLAPAAIKIVRLYKRLVSPWLPPACRFVPTCSEYAERAFETHGFLGGTRLTVWRLLRCQPFCKGGFDPVPKPKNYETSVLNMQYKGRQ
ncbi:MAG: membrane protein insertion efficiency factor YidD [Victivallales bacterium]|nr:membrane protein insertion efficiency factor YidD [Victivallales bacterium]